MTAVTVRKRLTRIASLGAIKDQRTAENGEEVLLATAPPDGTPPETDLVMTFGPPIRSGPGLCYLRHVYADGWYGTRGQNQARQPPNALVLR